MNKARRVELGKLKFKRRLKLYGLYEEWLKNKGNFNRTGKPCSCYLCSHDKYRRCEFKEQTRDIIKSEQ